MFCIKQANKICTMLSLHFWALKYNLRSYMYVSGNKSYILRFNPAGQGLTAVNFCCEVSDAQSTRFNFL